MVVLIIGIASGNKALHAAALWLGGLGLLVLVVAAVVGTTSASWTAGRRIAGRQPGEGAATGPEAAGPSGQLGSAALENLERLVRLRDAGALTYEEFDAGKRQILASQ